VVGGRLELCKTEAVALDGFGIPPGAFRWSLCVCVCVCMCVCEERTKIEYNPAPTVTRSLVSLTLRT